MLSRSRYLTPTPLRRSRAAWAMAVLLLAPPALLDAQPAPAVTTAPDAPGTTASLSARDAAPVPDEVEANGLHATDVRQRFNEVLRQYPPTLREVLRNDPSLLDDQGYLSSYPALAAFLRAHPQVARNAGFYIGDVDDYRPRDPHTQAIDLWRFTTETIAMVCIFLLVAGSLAWLVRTVLEHRRWLRSSRIQVDVHQKLFDRLASNADLMTYIQTPSGQRFLEGSPVVRDQARESPPVSAPINRMLWSVQIGIVLVTLGLGLQWAARQVIDEVAQMLWFVGVLAVTVGVGFVGSAGVAYLLSRRLGLIHETSGHDAPRSPAALP